MLLKGSLVSFGVLPNHIFNYLSVRLGSFNVTGLLLYRMDSITIPSDVTLVASI